MQTLERQPQNNNEIATAAIDKILKQVFGKEAASLIYKHMELNYSLKPDEVADKIELFTKGLEDFLNSGARVIEKKILQDIDCENSLLQTEFNNAEEEPGFVARIKAFTQKA
jgi:hypothetical protein